jgi:DNA-binding PadR family transcriptional regulator
MKKLEERAGGVYRASAGTMYPTLQLLEDEGLTASESQEGKRL